MYVLGTRIKFSIQIFDFSRFSSYKVVGEIIIEGICKLCKLEKDGLIGRRL